MAHKYAEVIKAFVSGEVVQYRYGEPFGWQDSSLEGSAGTMPNFDSDSIMWRLKPKTVTLIYSLILMKNQAPFDRRLGVPYRLICANSPSQLGVIKKAPDFVMVVRHPCEMFTLPEGV